MMAKHMCILLSLLLSLLLLLMLIMRACPCVARRPWLVMHWIVKTASDGSSIQLPHHSAVVHGTQSLQWLQSMSEAKRLGLRCYVESSGGVSTAAAIAGGEAVEDAADEEEDANAEVAEEL